MRLFSNTPSNQVQPHLGLSRVVTFFFGLCSCSLLGSAVMECWPSSKLVKQTKSLEHLFNFSLIFALLVKKLNA